MPHMRSASYAPAPAYFHNAANQDIYYRPINRNNNGSVALSTRLYIWRQDEGWALETYVAIKDLSHDLMSIFAHISQQNI
jgi:hypothetical protein